MTQQQELIVVANTHGIKQALANNSLREHIKAL